MALDRSSTTPPYIQIADDLAGQINDGTIAPDAALPSQQQLASTYGVANATVAAAIKELRARQLVYTQVGRGVFARTTDWTNPINVTMPAPGEDEHETEHVALTLTRPVLRALISAVKPQLDTMPDQVQGNVRYTVNDMEGLLRTVAEAGADRITMLDPHHPANVIARETGWAMRWYAREGGPTFALAEAIREAAAAAYLQGGANAVQELIEHATYNLNKVSREGVRKWYPPRPVAN